MDRRGFIKCLALTPLIGLLKPKQVYRGQITDIKVIDKELTGKEVKRGYSRKMADKAIKFRTTSKWQGRIDIDRYNQAIKDCDANITRIA